MTQGSEEVASLGIDRLADEPKGSQTNDGPLANDAAWIHHHMAHNEADIARGLKALRLHTPWNLRQTELYPTRTLTPSSSPSPTPTDFTDVPKRCLIQRALAEMCAREEAL